MASDNTVVRDVQMLTDFTQAGANGWQLATDRVMGGVSEGAARLVDGKAGAFAHLTGKVSTDNNGGFIQIRKLFDAEVANGFDGVVLRARGNDESYAIHLRNKHSVRPWLNYRQSFTVTDKWVDILLPFDAFKASRAENMPQDFDTSSLYSLGIVAIGGDFTADIQIQSVGFYRQSIGTN